MRGLAIGWGGGVVGEGRGWINRAERGESQGQWAGPLDSSYERGVMYISNVAHQCYMLSYRYIQCKQ